jgi:hypothetical protein
MLHFSISLHGGLLNHAEGSFAVTFTVTFLYQSWYCKYREGWNLE